MRHREPSESEEAWYARRGTTEETLKRIIKRFRIRSILKELIYLENRGQRQRLYIL